MDYIDVYYVSVDSMRDEAVDCSVVRDSFG